MAENDKSLKILSWISSSLILAPVVVITLFPGSGASVWMFFAFLIGHVLLSAYTFLKKETALLFMNLGLIILDLVGIYIRLSEPIDFLSTKC